MGNKNFLGPTTKPPFCLRFCQSILFGQFWCLAKTLQKLRMLPTVTLYRRVTMFFSSALARNNKLLDFQNYFTRSKFDAGNVPFSKTYCFPKLSPGRQKQQRMCNVNTCDKINTQLSKKDSHCRKLIQKEKHLIIPCHLFFSHLWDQICFCCTPFMTEIDADSDLSHMLNDSAAC